MQRSALALLLLLCACSGSGDREERAPGPPGPYVVAAVDYHFHDAHPSQPIAMDRAVEFSNEGSNVHNVTFASVRFSENVQPGEDLTIGPISDLVDEPGRYRFVCRFHADRGMVGVLVVVA